MTSQKQLFAVFNFYETITPPPNYPTFTAGWKTLGSYVETLDHYVAAQLHRNLDEQGLFPYVNFSTFTGTTERIIKDFMEPSPDLIKAVVEGHGMPGIQINHPGGYEEISTLSGKQIIPDLPAKLESKFIISGYRTIVSDNEFNNNIGDLEKDWLNWAGIEALKAAVPSGVSLGEAGLYKRFTPDGPFKAVTYTVRCEIKGLDADKTASLDLLSTIRNQKTPEKLELVDSSLYCLDKDLISLSAK
ncbi:uncharacterized protein LOC117291428 [Asterias rubens]|uniref:uncharacterized protein LOC117291428 n=1 Tax=Asterias rubens TaxID=7604 RepID=UPI001455B1FD|nr:uncharacterized protein LOC117291428 [Asterias rubens]XP_033628987.1 uncharacterized protein LOC117291428 [Asterias rubens]